MDIYGQFLYSDPKTTVNFNETGAGNFLAMSELLFYSSQQTIGTGAANQPHTTGTAGVEIRPLKHLRIIQNWLNRPVSRFRIRHAEHCSTTLPTAVSAA